MISGKEAIMANLVFKNADKVKSSIMESQKKEIANLYNDWADEIGEKAKFYSRKTTASAPVSERYYKELKKQLRETSQVVSNEVFKTIRNNIYVVSDAVVSDNIKWLKSFGFAEKGLNAAFSHVPDDIVRRLVTGQIYDSGWSLSKRIWGDNEMMLKDIYRVMAKGVAENMPIYEIAKNLEKYVRPNAALPWNLTAPDGVKIYKKQVDYNAQRLARTLVQHGYQQSFIATTENNPFVTEYIWRSNGSRVCPLCLSRDGQRFKKGELPMDHPNGMCTMEPVVVDDMVDQLANWFNSEDGTYPDIDNFAKNFGYEVKSKPKVDVNLDKLADNLEMYVGGGYSSVKDAVSPEEFQYIKNNMKSTSKSLYRVEDAHFTVMSKALEEGDIFSFTDDIRSFTRSRSYVDEILELNEYEDFMEAPVIFETVGDTMHFNMDKYAEAYVENQSESLVGGEFEVIGFDEREINGTEYVFVKIKQIIK